MLFNAENQTGLDGGLQLQGRLIRLIHGAEDPTDILDRVLDTACRLESVDGLWIWFMDQDTGRLNLRHVRGLRPEAAELLAHVSSDSSLYNQLLIGNEIAGDWRYAWEEQAVLLSREGWSDVAVWPLCEGEATVGALGAVHMGEGLLKRDDSLILGGTALQLGALIGRARMEASLRNSRYNLKQLFQSFEDYVFVAGRSGQILYCNADETEGLDLGSFSPVGELIGDYLTGVGARAEISQLIGPDGRGVFQSRLRLPGGHLVPVEVRTFEGRWDTRTAQYFICRDVSRQVVMEKERTRLITAIEQSDDSIIITDSGGVIQYTNPAFTRLTGYSREESLGTTPRILRSGSHPPEFYRGMWTTLARGEVWRGRIVNRKKNGDDFTEFVTISPVRDSSGIITHYVAVKRDITHEVELEQRLRQSQKMEAIGTLAGGLAHDFNNILYALLGYCQLALDDVGRDHPARPSLEEIHKAANRATNLVGKMLALGCRKDSDRIVVDLTPVVQEALDLARASLPTTILFDVRLESSRYGVKCDPTQIHQVVLNLCTNAEHAMRSRGGSLKVRLQEVDLGRADLRPWPNLSPGKHVRLIIEDTGSGMDQETLDRIFEPYFTTKDAHEGSGLGLATVQGIVMNHEGRIYVESRQGQGTTFTLFFPVSLDEQVSQEILDNVPGTVRGSGRIMVIDDEKMIVDVAVKSLKKMGFSVVGFSDGLKALQHFENDPHAVDLVVTDQTMPNLTGFELAARMLRVRPDLSIVMTTGYSEQLRDVELQEAGIALLLAKPLKIAKLAEAVTELLPAETPKLEV
jgi:PAS domain S-box-containing protein